VADLHSGPASLIFTADDVDVHRTSSSEEGALGPSSGSPRTSRPPFSGSSAQQFHEIRGCAEFQIEGFAGKLKLLGEKIDDAEDLLRERLPHSQDSDFRRRSISSSGSL
jgi:hypothetical protein